jgi:hypothetical protein
MAYASRHFHPLTKADQQFTVSSLAVVQGASSEDPLQIIWTLKALFRLPGCDRERKVRMSETSGAVLL